MMRNVLAAIVGYGLWTVVFLGGSAVVRTAMPAVHDEAGLTSDRAALVLYLLVSVLASLAAGFATARIARPPRTWVWILAAALLATGIPVQLSYWDQIPLWYNVAFLLLLVPMTLWGGRMGARGAARAAPAVP